MTKKIVTYLSIMIVFGGIIYLTTMRLDDTVYLSETFRNYLIKIFSKIGVDTSTEWWNSDSGIRLIGHVIEYFVLGLVVGVAIKRRILALTVCMFASLIDQTLKIFIPARHFDKGDIPFDIIGFFCGLSIAWILKYSIKKLKEI